jgi:tetratricopeptide (TPR) repeat protein/4-amino-4-deoxy-L-arabinose transferase-like glycosyltransferase
MSEFFTARATLLAFGLCAVLILVGGFMLTDLCIYTPDSARYLVWANSLAKFEGFMDRTLPEPEKYVVHAPLYSVFLAPTQALSANDVVAAKWVTLLFGALAVFLTWFWASKRIGKAPALLAALLLLVNPLFLQFTTEVLSDVPFIVCLLLFFLLSDRVAKGKETSVPFLLGFGMCIAAGVLLREVGAALLVAAVAYLLLEKRFSAAAIVFLVCAIPLGLWKVRNEVIVAGFEHPALANTQLMFSHAFTLPTESLVSEFFARVTTNAAVYLKTLPGLVLYPVYIRSYSNLVSFRDPLLIGVAGAMDILKYLLGTVSMVLASYGAWRDIRGPGGGRARLVFLICYTGIVLVYPVNDQRFLLPVLILMIYYAVLGCVELWQQRAASAPRRPAAWIAAALALLFLVPDLVWDMRYVVNCVSYRQSPAVYAEEIIKKEDYPWHFSRPFASVGAWLAAHSAPGDAIVAQWKDLAMWIGPRILIPANQNIVPKRLVSLVRDYGVRYVVSVQSKNGLLEFQVPMLLQDRYRFTPEAAFGNVMIYSVRPRDAGPAAETSDTGMFASAVRLIERKEYAEADALIQEIVRRYPASMNAIFYNAVVKELSMDLRSADSMFVLFGGFGQAAMYLDEAHAHRQIISLLARAGNERLPAPDRASMLLSAGAGYWDLGYRSQARDMLGRAMSIDSMFIPGIIFKMTFALQDDDTASARSDLTDLASRDAEHPMLPTFRTLFAHFDSLQSARTGADSSRQLMRIAETYEAIGLVEGAIDNALMAGRLPNHPAAVDLYLGKLYRSKGRILPAYRALLRAQATGGGSRELDTEIGELKGRLYLRD